MKSILIKLLIWLKGYPYIVYPVSFVNFLGILNVMDLYILAKGRHVHVHHETIEEISTWLEENIPANDYKANHMIILTDNHRGHVWAVKDYSRFGFKFRNETDMNLFLLHYREYFKRKPSSFQPY